MEHICLALFLGSLFCSIDPCVCPSISNTPSSLQQPYSKLNYQAVIPSPLFFLVKIILATLGSKPWHMNFRKLYLCTHLYTLAGFLQEILHLYVNLKRMEIFESPNARIKCFNLFRFSLISSMFLKFSL